MRRSVVHIVRVLVTTARVVALVFLPLLLVAWVESYFHAEHFSIVRDANDGEMLSREIWSVHSARGGVSLQYTRVRNAPHEYTIEMFNGDRAEHGTWRWVRGIPTDYPMVSLTRQDQNPFVWLGIEWHGWEADARNDPKFGRLEHRSPGVAFPYWLATLILGTCTVPWLLRARRLRRRRLLGLCLTCGYDLHATPERCPECGATPASRAAA